MKKNKKTTIFLLCMIIILAVVFLSKNSNANTDKIVEKTQQIAEVSNQTIVTTLTAPGEVKSANIEKISLNTNYYFLTMCAEKEEYVKKGSNLLKYTNGTYITAPYDCVIVSSELPVEDEICTTSHYVEIKSIETLCMNLSVSESDINKIEIGDVVNITITASNEKIEGYITSISEVGTYSSSGSYFTAVVTFENNGNLKIGMSATCEIVIEKAENVVSVPKEAIQTSDDGTYVIVLNSDGSTTNTKVETGISNDAYIEIKSGITEGTKVQLSTESSSSTNTNNRSNRGNFEGGVPMEMPSGENSGGGMHFSGMPSGGTQAMP